MLINPSLRLSVKHSALVLKTSIASIYPRRRGSLRHVSEGWVVKGGREFVCGPTCIEGARPAVVMRN